MAVKAEGRTVRGYKVEQFAQAFHRVLGVTGVTSVTSVTSRTASEAECNAGNASNAQHPVVGTNGRVVSSVSPGFPEFRDFIDDALQAGHITEAEWLERRTVHALLVGPA